MRPARAFAMRLTDEVASTGDWSGTAGVAAGVVGGGACTAGAARWPAVGARRGERRVPGSGSSAGVIFLCFLLAILHKAYSSPATMRSGAGPR